MSESKQDRIVGKLVPFTVRLPEDLALELPSIAKYLLAKDQTDLVRTWTRENSLKIMSSKAYQLWKEQEKQKALAVA